MRPLVALASILAFTAAAAMAEVTETVTVHLVEVPVIVTDRGGNRVRALSAANFELEEARSNDVTKMMFRYAPSALAAGNGTLAFTIRKKDRTMRGRGVCRCAFNHEETET